MSKYISLIRDLHTLLSSAVLVYFMGVIGGIAHHLCIPGHVAHSVTCLITDACLIAVPVVGILIPAQSRTYVEIYHEMISAVILLPPAISFKILLSVTSESMYTKYWLTACSSLPMYTKCT